MTDNVIAGIMYAGGAGITIGGTVSLWTYPWVALVFGALVVFFGLVFEEVE